MLLSINIAAGYNAPTDLLLESRVKAIENYYKANTDSLQRELTYYKAKEDYYAAALGEQANRFGLIIAGLLTFAGLVSWGWFAIQQRINIKNFQKSLAETKDFVEKQIGETNTKYKKVDNELNELSISLRKISATTSQLLIPSLRSMGDLPTIMYQQISTASLFSQIAKLSRVDKDKQIAEQNLIDCIHDATKTLNDIISENDQNQIIKLHKSTDELLENLKYIMLNTDTNDIHNAVAICRTLILSITSISN